MSIDHNFYPENIKFINDWIVKEGKFPELKPNSAVFLKIFIRVPAATEAILSFEGIDEVTEMRLNQGILKFRDSSPSKTFLPFSLDIELKSGWNEYLVKIHNSSPESRKSGFRVLVSGANGLPVPGIIISREMHDIMTKRTEMVAHPENVKDFLLGKISDFKISNKTEKIKKRDYSLKGFRKGTGGEESPSCGRFGFTKGDGILDCSMPYLGIITKPHVLGHPKNEKVTQWTISTLPPGTDTAKQLSTAKTNNYNSSTVFRSQDDKVSVNWLSVNWQTTLKAIDNFYERKAGSYVNFSATYSLGTPGILIETDDPALSLGNLKGTSNFRNIALPLGKGITVRNTAVSGKVYDMENDGKLADNWILLWGTDSFPDIPVMLVLEKNPSEIIFKRNGHGDIESIDIHSQPEFGYAVLLCPFGIEMNSPEKTGSVKWMKEAVSRCLFWSKAVLAYPVSCEEYFKVRESDGTVDIIQNFSYRHLVNEWNSEPIETAPLPPPLSLGAGRCKISIDKNASDLRLPTKYGYLYGVAGSSQSRYTLAIPPLNREFQLKKSGDRSIEKLMSEDMKDYFAFYDEMKDIQNPGIYSFINQYAYPLTLFNFLKPEHRKEISRRIFQGMKKALDAKGRYSFKGGKKCCCWYERTEPFTKVKYLINYLHITGIRRFRTCSRNEVEASQFPLIEVDWGNGFALYGLYLSALLTGNWKIIKENWETIKGAFRYFEVMQDWACMAAAYTEQGISWNDGTNYGGYIGFSQMARITGDKDTYEKSLYILAKESALRIGVFLSSQNYFYKFFDVPPWWITKFFHEELTPEWAFTSVPGLQKNVRNQGLYNLSTEGLYPEAINLYNKFLDNDFSKFIKVLENAYPDWDSYPMNEKAPWHAGLEKLGSPEIFSLLLMKIMDNKYKRTAVGKNLENAFINKKLPSEILGSPLSLRRVPENWTYCFLKTQLEGREYPAALTTWHNVRIDSAEYDPAVRKVTIRIAREGDNAWLELSLRKKPVSINGRKKVTLNGNLLKIDIKAENEIKILF